MHGHMASYLVAIAIGGEIGGKGGMAPLKSKPLHRNVIFAIENHFSLVKWPPLFSVASSASGYSY